MFKNNFQRRWDWSELVLIIIVNSGTLLLVYFKRWESVDLLFLYLVEAIISWVYIEGVYIYHWLKKDIIISQTGLEIAKSFFTTLGLLLASIYIVVSIFGWTEKLGVVILISAVFTIIRVAGKLLIQTELASIFTLRTANYFRLGLVVLVGSSAAAFLVYDDLAKYYLMLYFIGIRFLIDIVIWFYSALMHDSPKVYKRESFPLPKS